MKHHLPPLDTLKAFEAAARHLSFSLAADELCISKGAVSYQIRKLEEQLQCALFRRTVRQVYLTDAGQALLQSTQRLFHDLGDTLHRLRGESQQAGISIAATTYVAARWLSSRISSFSERYPNIPIHLQHSVDAADFKLTEVDLAIRWGPCHGRRDRNRFAEIPMPLFPVLSPALLQRNGLPLNQLLDTRILQQAPFNQIPLLCEDRQQDIWQEWFNSIDHHGDASFTNPRRVISDANVRVQTAVDGLGLILADDLMRTEISNHLLVAPFAERLTGYGYALLHSPSRIHGDNTLALKHWLTEHLSPPSA
ncbi:MAG: LysR family transcriptional regulator [Thiolinea sp.]